jgi:hypothetical protein
MEFLWPQRPALCVVALISAAIGAIAGAFVRAL